MPHDDEDDKENEDMEDPDTRLHSEHSSISVEDNPKPIISHSARLTDARVQKDTELSDSEDEGLGGRRHRQNHNEPQNSVNSKRKGKATMSPTGSLSRRSKQPEASGSRDSSMGPSVPLQEPQAGADETASAEPPRTVSTGAIVPTSTLADDDQMDVDPQGVDAELHRVMETGLVDNVGASTKPSTEQSAAPAATPQTTADDANVAHPPAFASDSILPVGKHASEVGERTPEPSNPVTE